jgi:hypothetical protein
MGGALMVDFWMQGLSSPEKMPNQAQQMRTRTTERLVANRRTKNGACRQV